MNWCKHISTLGFIGYLPMPGTCATIVTIPCVYALNVYGDFWIQLFVALMVVGVGYYCVNKVLPEFDEPDPCCIIIDEVAGTLVTFLAIKVSPFSIILGFLLFRFFDISKPGLVGKIDKIRGVHGVMGDDIVAGIFANILLRLCLFCLI